MNMKITAVTMELDKIKDKEFRDSLDNILNVVQDSEETFEEKVNEFFRKLFSEFAGKNAGICYMAEPYTSQKISGYEESMKRFRNTIISTHHSIADHCKVTVLFENVPKIFAMVMNSLQDYATSEKSARYTVMSNLSEEENLLYNKWREKLKNVLLEKDVPEANAEKLANENARYFISVFSPATTFSYTTSIRQWNYINVWFNELINVGYPEDYPEYIKRFSGNLRPWLLEFKGLFENSLIYNDLIEEPKSRRIYFIPQLYPDTLEPIYQKEIYSDSYSSRYYVSFSSLAQLHRHRSIKYVINDLSTIDRPVFFIPDFIKDDPAMVEEWSEDMNGCKDNFPQGLVIEVFEFGTIDKFLLKCDERLCGRAQYETMQCVKSVLMMFCEARDCSPYYNQKVLDWFELGEDKDTFRVKAKCEMRVGGCADKGGCLHGPKNATERTF